MGMTIDDSVKQKLLDSLAEEPTMVISTAYAYAKNYVKYGEDITKEWTTAVQQASMIEKVSLNARVQAYETFKKEYENRLKADMVAMLTDIQSEIDKIDIRHSISREDIYWNMGARAMREKIKELTQEKINSLKESENE